MGTPTSTSDINLMMPSELTDAEVELADLYIDMAEGEIEAWLGRPIGEEEFTETIFPEASGAVYFKNKPVISVTSFAVNSGTNTVFTPDSITVVSYGLENIWELWWYAEPFVQYQVWNDAVYGGKVEVTYTAGLGYPAAIRSVVAGAVTNRMMQDRAQAAQESSVGSVGTVKMLHAEDYQIEYFPASSGGSTISFFPDPDKDLRMIKRYKRRGIL